MKTRRFEFHLIDRRNGHRAVKRLAYTSPTDGGVFGHVDWEWFDAGCYACCDYHRAHALYGFGNPNEPPDLLDLTYDGSDGSEQISVERIVDADSGEEWTPDTFPAGALYEEGGSSAEF